MVLITYH